MSVEVIEEDGATVTTVVDLPSSPEPVVVETPDVNVTVVETPDSSPDVAPLIDHEGRLVRIEAAVTELVAIVSANVAATAVANETATIALEVATEEPEPEPVEPDKSPEKPHFLHRTWPQLVGKE